MPVSLSLFLVRQLIFLCGSRKFYLGNEVVFHGYFVVSDLLPNLYQMTVYLFYYTLPGISGQYCCDRKTGTVKYISITEVQKLYHIHENLHFFFSYIFNLTNTEQCKITYLYGYRQTCELRHEKTCFSHMRTTKTQISLISPSVVRYLDSITPILAKSKILRL